MAHALTVARELFGKLPPWSRVFLGVLLVYVAGTCGRATGANAHTQLAWAMLEGSFVQPLPYGSHEVIHFGGRQYIAYGPTPALVLMPFVAILGRSINQMMVSACLGALAVVLWWVFLGQAGVGARPRRWLTVLFAFGSPFFFYAAFRGDNWGFTHSTAIFCLLATAVLARNGNAGLAGLFFGLGVVSRNPVLLLLPIYVLLLAPDARDWREVRLEPGKLAIFAAGLGIALGAGAYYNWERFGNPFENGYKLILDTDPIADFGRKAAFALEYARHNVPFYLFQPPIRFDRFPWYGPDIWGLSMFLVFPAWLLVPLADWRRPLHQVSLLGVLVVQALYFFFIGDGRTQFGMRYALDYLPVLMVLVAGATARRFGKFAIALTIAGILVEIWGLATWVSRGW